LRKETTSKAIATREDRQSFWTEVMRDKLEKMVDRLRASELLGKSQADFVDRMEVKELSDIDKMTEEEINLELAQMDRWAAIDKA
jgi:hypothetical protein